MLGDVESFVVRVWVPGEDEAAGEAAELRGVVEQVASGEAMPFGSAEELSAILRARSRQDENDDERT